MSGHEENPREGTPESFDEWAQYYDGWFNTPRGAKVLELEKDLVLSLSEPQPERTALDVGCGTGNFIEPLLHRGMTVAGVDTSAEMLAVARKKLESYGSQVELLQGSMLDLPYDDGAFDLVLSVSCLEGVDQPEAGVQEMWRVTAPGGRMVLAVLNRESPWAEERLSRADPGIWKRQEFYTWEQLLHLLQKACQVEADAITWSGTVFFGPKPTEEELQRAWELEDEGRKHHPHTGAMLVARVIRSR